MNEINTLPALKYPVGMQDFAYIRKNGFVYVDKTADIYRLAQTSKYVFLSRPRRFGKSLLCSTIKYYFEGQRELFHGLAIEQLEQEWTTYPVIHLSLGGVKPYEPGLWRKALLDCLRPYEKIYGEGESSTLGGRLGELIQKAFDQTGRPVALIVDEYDAPLLSVLEDKDALDAVRAVMKEFYSPLKDADPYLRFCFITGVSKFSQLSIFSTINNLRNISMLTPFAAICGITETELHQALGAGVAALSQTMECSIEACFAKLKELYDGYHFVRNSEDIYNPFSLLRALDDKELQFYWFSTGTPTFLIQSLQYFQVDPMEIDGVTAASSQFDVPTEAMDSAIPLLYQSGYLTIKGYHSDVDEYVLGFPNKEVRVGLSECLLPAVSGVNSGSWNGIQRAFCRSLLNSDLEGALVQLRSYFAGIPYLEGGKKFLDKAATAEWYYGNIFYLLFSFMNRSIHTEVKSALGRADMVMYTSHTIYVFEFKVNHSADEALKQIDEKGYMVPFEADGRKLVKCGVEFSSKLRTLKEWKVVQVDCSR